jgi:hypothetical protein
MQQQQHAVAASSSSSSKQQQQKRARATNELMHESYCSEFTTKFYSVYSQKNNKKLLQFMSLPPYFQAQSQPSAFLSSSQQAASACGALLYLFDHRHHTAPTGDCFCQIPKQLQMVLVTGCMQTVDALHSATSQGRSLRTVVHGCVASKMKSNFAQQRWLLLPTPNVKATSVSCHAMPFK